LLFSHCADATFVFLSLWSTVETESERKDSQRRFWKWLNSPEIKRELGTNLTGKIHAFWATSLQETENNWAADKTADIPTFDVRTTNASEQMNSSTKNGCMAVNPCQRTDRAAHTMMNKSNHRLLQKQKKDCKTSISNPLWSRSDSKDILTEHAEGLAVAMLDRRNCCAVVQMSRNKWWVLWVEKQEITVKTGKDDFDETDMHSRKRYHPIYKRVRVVELLDDNTMVCSCNRHRRHLMTCGHIMLIAGISHPTMFHVRWWNSFQLHCARDQKLTEHFNKMLMKRNDAVCVKGLNIGLEHG